MSKVTFQSQPSTCTSQGEQMKFTEAKLLRSLVESVSFKLRQSCFSVSPSSLMGHRWRCVLCPSRRAILVKMDDRGTPYESNQSSSPPTLDQPTRPLLSSLLNMVGGLSVPASQLNHLSFISTQRELCQTLLSRVIAPLQGLQFNGVTGPC